jgi:hypothetical protein
MLIKSGTRLAHVDSSDSIYLRRLVILDEAVEIFVRDLPGRVFSESSVLSCTVACYVSEGPDGPTLGVQGRNNDGELACHTMSLTESIRFMDDEGLMDNYSAFVAEAAIAWSLGFHTREVTDQYPRMRGLRRIIEFYAPTG